MSDGTDADVVETWTNGVHEADAFDLLEELPEESVHAVVTDPPYGLAFMGRDWDDFEPREYQEWCREWGELAKRVLKPGGHLLAFSGNRTHHRLFAGVEDAGFEIRDTLTWHYSNGFPKALDVDQYVDEGNESWEGWRTGLKPATEFVVMARKPLSEDTVAENVLEHGTAALNIDGCRVPTSDDTERTTKMGEDYSLDGEQQNFAYSDGERATGGHEDGRYPTNVTFDEHAGEALDREVGELKPGAHTTGGVSTTIYDRQEDSTGPDEREPSDSGGPSRYFYTSKASRGERTLDGAIENPHPTVKPTDLMEWLVRLVTREGQIVLDPFAGSGTTCLAAKNLGREFIAIEQQPQYVAVAQARAGVTVDEPEHLVGDDGQQLLPVADGGDSSATTGVGVERSQEGDGR